MPGRRANWLNTPTARPPRPWANGAPQMAIPQPYHVKFWGIGNEPWGDYQMGAMSLAAIRAEAQPLRQGDAQGRSVHQADCRRRHARRDGGRGSGKTHQRPICSRLSFGGRLDRPDAPQLPRQHRYGQRALLRFRHPAHRHETAEEGAHRSSSVVHRVAARAGRPGPREIRALPGVPEAHSRAPRQARSRSPSTSGPTSAADRTPTRPFLPTHGHSTRCSATPTSFKWAHSPSRPR